LIVPLLLVFVQYICIVFYIKFANCGYLGVEAVVLLASAFRLQGGVVVGYDVTLGTGTPAKQGIL
jgi:hypothetical protein